MLFSKPTFRHLYIFSFISLVLLTVLFTTLTMSPLWSYLPFVNNAGCRFCFVCVWRLPAAASVPAEKFPCRHTALAPVPDCQFLANPASCYQLIWIVWFTVSLRHGLHIFGLYIFSSSHNYIHLWSGFSHIYSPCNNINLERKNKISEYFSH